MNLQGMTLGAFAILFCVLVGGVWWACNSDTQGE